MSSIKDKSIFEKTSFLSGANSAFVKELYAKYIYDPSTISSDWRNFFDGLGDEKKVIETEIKGPSWAPKKNNISKNN